MTLMTKKRNRKMLDFKPREEWDQEHEANVAKLLGKKAASGGGDEELQAPGAYWTETLFNIRRVMSAQHEREQVYEYQPTLPTPPETEIRIRRIIVVLHNPVPDNFAIKVVCPCVGRWIFQCYCNARIWWNPLAGHDGHCPGCGSLIEAQISLRKGGRIRMVAVYGNGDIPGL